MKLAPAAGRVVRALRQSVRIWKVEDLLPDASGRPLYRNEFAFSLQ